MTHISYDNVVARLLERVPEFGRVYEEHLEFTEGEVLTHSLFGDLVIFTAKVCQSLSKTTGEFENPQDILDRILDFIEDAAQSDDIDVVNVVAVSFLEELPKSGLTGEYGVFIKSRLRPESLDLLKEVDRFWGGNPWPDEEDSNP